MPRLINVGIADLLIAQKPDILRTILGSCVGICFYDQATGTGGLSHIMLPATRYESAFPKKYADSAVPMLVEEFQKLDIPKTRIRAKIIGGATMFKMSENSLIGEIGKSNIVKVREILAELRIEIVAEDVGGDYGRTIDFFTETGQVKIKTINRQDIYI